EDTFTLKNDGARHALMSAAVLKLQETSSSLPIVLQGDAVTAFEGQNMLAGLSRLFFVPWDAAVIGAQYTGTFDAEIE
ncbi:hypothetical protein LWX53_07630, partial [bacterium]|nr:hypothetical protein [bacterium]